MNGLAILRLLSCIVACVPTATGFTADATRTWQDVTGKFVIDARLLRADGAEVVLDTVDGRHITIPIEKLSKADRDYLGSLSDDTSNELRPVNPRRFRVRMGVEVVATNGLSKNVVGTFPLPRSWPEQQVKIIEREVEPPSLRVSVRTIDNGVDQVEFRANRLNSGRMARVVYTLEITKHQILPMPNPERLQFANKPNLELKRYLGESPFIEIRNKKVRDAADSLELVSGQTAWQQIETIYDWTRRRVKASGTRPLKGALYALTAGHGDCEERTSLFVAMCRLKGIPARSVWVDQHTYPEFYLADSAGRGHWIPCESLGQRNFGGISTYQIIFQKGDRFLMKQKRGPQRYVTPTVSGLVGPGGAQPTLREIREVKPIGAP